MARGSSEAPEGKRLSQSEKDRVIAKVRDNPAYDTPHSAQAREWYYSAASVLLAEITGVGFDVNSVGGLQRIGRPYQAAIPLLLKWLPQVHYLPLAEDIVRTLMVPYAKTMSVPVLIELFRRPTEHLENPLRPSTNPVPMKEDFRWVLGLALGFHAHQDVSGELLELVQDPAFGVARGQIVLNLPKVKDTRVPQVLLSLLYDPAVRVNAIEALGKIKYDGAARHLEGLLNHEDKDTRDQAKKAIRRISTGSS